ncbi:hypothetical protein DFJ63DRAFT_337945 [Scheffersomyces coipomensis]|uniref:uncharacterized protein n=1 Tax=Scheffersomyces coipomensis TaxID=1788519 RepID=UPI00315C8CCB
MNMLEKEKELPLYFKDIDAKQNNAKKRRKTLGIMVVVFLIGLLYTYNSATITTYLTSTSVSNYSPIDSKPNVNLGSIALSSSTYNSAEEELKSTNLFINQIATRDDTSSDSSSSSSTKSTPIYDIVGVRIGFALVGFVLLNMIAIVIHHIFLKVSRASQAYKNVELHYSPF